MTTETDAAAIATRFAGEPARSVERFPTGLAHYVYDVTLASGRPLVVRIAAAGAGSTLANAAYWNRTLRPLEVPLPALFEAGERDGAAYLILERLPGTDLGLVYRTLSSDEKRAIAAEVVRAQRAVAALPEGRGFGYVGHPDGPFPHHSWPDVLRGSLRRSRARIARGAAFDPAVADAVERALERRAGLLAAVLPRAFLDDTTTKNVLVADGRLSGIVDVDCVCYGDALLPVALTRTSLLHHGQDTDYVEHWCEHLGLDAERRAVLALYTAVFCVDFMGEVGQRFNRSEPIPIDERAAAPSTPSCATSSAPPSRKRAAGLRRSAAIGYRSE